MQVLHDTWSHQSFHDHPFKWISTQPGGVFHTKIALALSETFPSTGMLRRDTSVRNGGSSDKKYKNFSRALFHPDCRTDIEDLHPVWRNLISDLRSEEYRRKVSKLLDQPLAESVELRAVVHAAGDWLSPHTDRPDKTFSHIFYLNREWHEHWGGCLEILEGSDPSSVIDRVVPRLGASALMARAENSWHQVAPVRPEITQTRMSLLVHGLS